MKQVASRGRILLRKILTALSLGAVAVTFQACYGMPMDDEFSALNGDDKFSALNGMVKSSDTENPIPGIRVSGSDDFTLTGSNGNYRLYVDDRIQTILFQDIDGPDNGWFQDKEVLWNPRRDGRNLPVFLDPK